jgi:hypothetical protein
VHDLNDNIQWEFLVAVVARTCKFKIDMVVHVLADCRQDVVATERVQSHLRFGSELGKGTVDPCHRKRVLRRHGTRTLRVRDLDPYEHRLPEDLRPLTLMSSYVPRPCTER